MLQPVAKVTINLRRLNRFKAQVASDLANQTNGPVRKALKQWAVRYRSFAQERFDAFSKGAGDWPPLSPSTIARRRKGKQSKKKKTAGPKKPKKTKFNLGKSITTFFKYVMGKKPKKPKKTSASPTGGKTPKKKPKKKPYKAPAKKKNGEQKVTILRDLGILFAVLSPVFTSKPGAVQVDRPFGVTVGYGGPHKHSEDNPEVTIADIASFHQVGGGYLPQRKIIVGPPLTVQTAMAEDMRKALEKMRKDGSG